MPRRSCGSIGPRFSYLAARATAEVESWAAGLAPERYVEAMSAGGETFIVAVAPDGALAGFCSFKGDEVKGLYVAPDWARRGVGSALLRQAEATIGAGGHRLIHIVASPLRRGLLRASRLSGGRAARLDVARRSRQRRARHGEGVACGLLWLTFANRLSPHESTIASGSRKLALA